MVKVATEKVSRAQRYHKFEEFSNACAGIAAVLGKDDRVLAELADHADQFAVAKFSAFAGEIATAEWAKAWGVRQASLEQCDLAHVALIKVGRKQQETQG